jgi:mannose-1-phosphate guanylyltransferase
MTFAKNSIDYHLIERPDDVRMEKAEFALVDVGAWNSLGRVVDPDENRNCNNDGRRALTSETTWLTARMSASE